MLPALNAGQHDTEYCKLKNHQPSVWIHKGFV